MDTKPKQDNKALDPSERVETPPPAQEIFPLNQPLNDSKQKKEEEVDKEKGK